MRDRSVVARVLARPRTIAVIGPMARSLASPARGQPPSACRRSRRRAPSGRSRSGRARTAAISAGVWPVAIRSAISRPKIGEPLNPHVPMPDIRKNRRHVRLAEQRRGIRGHVAQTRPLPHRARLRDRREDLDRALGRLARGTRTSSASSTCVREDLRADEQLAARGLRDVHVQVHRRQQAVEDVPVGLGDERLQRHRRRSAAARPPSRRPGWTSPRSRSRRARPRSGRGRSARRGTRRRRRRSR